MGSMAYGKALDCKLLHPNLNCPTNTIQTNQEIVSPNPTGIAVFLL